MSGFCPFHYTVFPDDFPQVWGKWRKKATLVCAYQGSGKVGRYMSFVGVEYATIDEAMEAGAA